MKFHFISLYIKEYKTYLIELFCKIFLNSCIWATSLVIVIIFFFYISSKSYYYSISDYKHLVESVNLMAATPVEAKQVWAKITREIFPDFFCHH